MEDEIIKKQLHQKYNDGYIDACLDLFIALGFHTKDFNAKTITVTKLKKAVAKQIRSLESLD